MTQFDEGAIHGFFVGITLATGIIRIATIIDIGLTVVICGVLVGFVISYWQFIINKKDDKS